MKRCMTLCLTVAALAVGILCEVRALPGDDPKDAELRRKAEEVDRLRKELVQQETELKRLQQENERLRRQKTPAAVAGPASATAPKPVTPIAALPSLVEGSVVEASELAGHFAQEGSAAAQRYVGRQLKVRGEVLRFGRGVVTRDYSIILGTGDPANVLVCNFTYSDSYAAVYPKGHGGELVARTKSGSEIPLARAGQIVTISGKCKGFKNGEVLLTGCSLVR